MDGRIALIHEADHRAVKLLEAAARPGYGVMATADATDLQYATVWARDALYSAFALLKKKMSRPVRDSLDQLAKHQTKFGQIPNIVWPNGDKDFGEGGGGTVDATALFVIILAKYVQDTGDTDFGKHMWPKVRLALHWLESREVTGWGLISNAFPTAWKESSFSAEGVTLELNVLYYWAAKELKALAETLRQPVDWNPDYIRQQLNTFFWMEKDLDWAKFTGSEKWNHKASIKAAKKAYKPGRKHLISHYRWAKFVDVFDTHANLMAIASGAVDGDKANAILDYIVESKVNQPFALRTYPKSWTDRFNLHGMFDRRADRNQPRRWKNNQTDRYHRGGFWPLVALFWVESLLIMGRDKEAIEAAVLIAKTNQWGNWQFNEWLSGRLANPLWRLLLRRQLEFYVGQILQTWSAAATAYSTELLDERDLLGLAA
jgi:glycogen debranching enzyme